MLGYPEATLARIQQDTSVVIQSYSGTPIDIETTHRAWGINTLYKGLQTNKALTSCTSVRVSPPSQKEIFYENHCTFDFGEVKTSTYKYLRAYDIFIPVDFLGGNKVTIVTDEPLNK